jgi:hypothetical protein
LFSRFIQCEKKIKKNRSAITNRSLFEELRWLKTAKKVPHGTREKLNIEFPFAQLTGTVRDVNGTRVPLVGTRALWPSPQLWVVTQKRVFAHQWVDTWRSAVAAMDESHRPLFCELMLVDELLWKLTKRVVERNVASTLPSAVDRTHVLGHYGKLTNDVIAACGGLRYQVLPTALLIDAKGRLRWRTIGVCEQADVEEIATLVQSLNSA